MRQRILQIGLRAFALWLLLMTAEFVHGVWRAKVLALWLGDFPARQVCVFTGSLLILLLTYVCIPWIPARETRTLLGVGLGWAVLTLLFEVCFGYFVLHRPCEDLASDFDMGHGGMFPIGLAVLTLSPVIAARWRGFSAQSARAERGEQGRVCDLDHQRQ
jgi:hypothetical protein